MKIWNNENWNSAHYSDKDFPSCNHSESGRSSALRKRNRRNQVRRRIAIEDADTATFRSTPIITQSTYKGIIVVPRFTMAIDDEMTAVSV